MPATKSTQAKFFWIRRLTQTGPRAAVVGEEQTRRGQLASQYEPADLRSEQQGPGHVDNREERQHQVHRSDQKAGNRCGLQPQRRLQDIFLAPNERESEHRHEGTWYPRGKTILDNAVICADSVLRIASSGFLSILLFRGCVHDPQLIEEETE